MKPLRLGVRLLVTWAIEAAGLFLMLRYLPGVTVARWDAAVVAVLIIGLLNALVRPLVLVLAANFGIIPFVLVALPLNALLILVAAQIVPGFDVDGPLTAFLVAVGLAALNATFSAMLSINDDDSFYRNVIRRMGRRRAPVGELDRMGTVIVQIDGLAEPILRRALLEGRMPTLAGWLAAGSHRLAPWECDIPSMTTSSQAGILHGTNENIPAFYWYEKRERRLMSSANPRDLQSVQRRVSDGNGLLSDDGVSVTNLFSGDAKRAIMTVGTLQGEHGELLAHPQDFYGYLINPYNLYRGLAGMLGEALLEIWQAFRQWAGGVRPRIRRIGLFVIQRGAALVVLRDATTWAVIASMYRGRRIIYCDYLGYDEVGHFAGPETEDAVATLTAIDLQLRQLAHAAKEAPREYQFVVLSDHGQTTARLFRDVYGRPLDAMIRELIDVGPTLMLSGGKGEKLAYLSAFLNELIGGRGLPGGDARRLRRSGGTERSVDLLAERMRRNKADAVEVVVTSSGNLGHIYFAQVPDRLSLEQIAAAYPGLIEALVQHEGIEFVLVHSDTRGTVVLGKQGIRALDEDDVVEGEDPLAEFSPNTGHFLNRLATFPNAGDIIINGAYDPKTGWVVGIDDLVGAHGGVGGMQTRAFIAYPSTWNDEAPELIGSASVNRFLVEHTSRALPDWALDGLRSQLSPDAERTVTPP